MKPVKPLSAEEIKAINSLPINFVVGKERSGTTLLQLMLNAHPNILAPPESRFLVLLYSRYGSIQHWSEKNLRAFCTDLFREPLFKKHWVLDKQKLLEILLPAKDLLTYPILCKIIFLQKATPEKEVTLLFDKNPIYYYFLPLLEKIFPEARFIQLVRDYRANIASHQRVFKIKRAGDLAYRWVKINEMIEDSKLRNPGRYFTLKYESLVTDPETSMKGICSFLKIQFSEKMTGDHTAFMYDSFKEDKHKRFTEIHQSLFQPINVAHIDEWKRKLSTKEIDEAETVAGNYGNIQYGYVKVSTNHRKINIAKKLSIRIRYWLIKTTYQIVFSKLRLYYFIKRKVWRDF